MRRRGSVKVFANQQNALVNRSIFDLKDFNLIATANGSILAYDPNLSEIITTDSLDASIESAVVDGGTF